MEAKIDTESLPPLRVAIQTYGCRSNYADTVDLQAALMERGAELCSLDDHADVYVINSCTVTDSADREALRLAKKLNAKAPKSRIVFTGCMAEVGKQKIREQTAADTVIGPGRRGDLVAAIFGEELAADNQESGFVSEEDLRRRVKRSLPRRRTISLGGEISNQIAGPGVGVGSNTMRARYHLRIQEGCENSCTFCIIPQVRGLLSSREPEEILNDLEHLKQVGYHEVVLSGTHIGGWGLDRGSSFYRLLTLLEEKSPIPRVRISSIDPNDLDKKMIDLLANSSVFCNHLHICFQAFSDRILKRMNRKYRLEEAVDLVNYAAEVMPHCGIGTDIITGFPGESRQEVEQGIDLFLRLPFSYLHVFPYSERSNTAATRLDGAVPISERKRRAARWRAAAERKREEFLRSLIGREVEFVVEKLGPGVASGTSSEFASCEAALPDESEVRSGQTLFCRVQSYNEARRTLQCEL